MASRMNSGGSIDLNRIKIDPRTGEKLSFNVDIHEKRPLSFTHVHSCISSNGMKCKCLVLLYCTLRHCRPMKSVVT